MNRRGFLALVVALVLIGHPGVRPCPAAAGEDPPRNPETARRFREWVDSTKDRMDYPPPIAEDPAYEGLLRSPDADLYFLDIARPSGGNHVETFAAKGLVVLRTERTVQALLKRAEDPGMFIREKALGLLSMVGGDSARRALLSALKSDKEIQIRSMVSDRLRCFPSEETEEALLAAMEGDPRVASRAAQSLGLLGTVRAAGRIRGLITTLCDPSDLENALNGLRSLRSPEAVGYLLEIYCEPPAALTAGWRDRWRDLCECSLREHVEAVSKQAGPEPDTTEQWADWWARAQPLFDGTMKRVEQPLRSWPPEAFGRDGASLLLRATLDERTYRIGDPIRLELTLENPTDRPYRTRVPRAPSPWERTMGFGILLERTSPGPTAILYEVAPSKDYSGSYSGPPESVVLAPHETFRHRVCYQSFLRSRKAWPTREGTYRLTISFDAGQFAGAQPVQGEVFHHWTALPVLFEVEGPSRVDGEEQIRLIGEKAESRWLLSDLESRKGHRREAAWSLLREYGDARLVPFVKEKWGEEGLRCLTNWGPPRPFIEER